jgi:hypothetical protein
MSTCKIKKTLSGKSEKIYHLIKYLKQELENRGLNPKINLVVSDEKTIDLFTSLNINIPSIPASEMHSTIDPKFTQPLQIDSLFGSFNTSDPDVIKDPYRGFKEGIEKYVGGVYKEEIEIEIEIK